MWQKAVPRLCLFFEACILDLKNAVNLRLPRDWWARTGLHWCVRFVPQGCSSLLRCVPPVLRSCSSRRSCALAQRPLRSPLRSRLGAGCLSGGLTIPSEAFVLYALSFVITQHCGNFFGWIRLSRRGRCPDHSPWSRCVIVPEQVVSRPPSASRAPNWFRSWPEHSQGVWGAQKLPTLEYIGPQIKQQVQCCYK